ncbi:MAG: DUF4286 family protein [Acidobacteria bacterium]|nr:DUF4286 family protein [Acidobacteriota bacterium]
METSVLYEVTVTVESSLAEAFAQYMTGRHIPEVIATGCFLHASFVTDRAGTFRTTYHAADRSDLDRYLNEFAEGLRDDFAAHFPDGVAVKRQEWQSVAEFGGTGVDKTR